MIHGLPGDEWTSATESSSHAAWFSDELHELEGNLGEEEKRIGVHVIVDAGPYDLTVEQNTTREPRRADATGTHVDEHPVYTSVRDPVDNQPPH